MRASRHGWVVGVLLIALSLCVTGVMQAQPENPADVNTARELFREGLELSKQNKWEEARVKLGQSLALKKAALTYYTLAVADKRSGHPVAALEHFRGFLAQPVTPKTEGFIEAARNAVVELEKIVAGVTIDVSPDDVDGLVVRLDGDVVPHSTLGRRRLIDPGEHTVTAKGSRHLEQSRTFSVGEGETVDLDLTLQPAPDAGGETPDEFPVVPVVLLTVGGAVGIGGLVLGIVGAQEAKKAPTQDGPEADAALTKTIIGDVMMGVGGATAAVGLVLLIVHLVSDDEPDPVALQPWAAGDVVGVQVRF